MVHMGDREELWRAWWENHHSWKSETAVDRIITAINAAAHTTTLGEQTPPTN